MGPAFVRDTDHNCDALSSWVRASGNPRLLPSRYSAQQASACVVLYRAHDRDEQWWYIREDTHATYGTKVMVATEGEAHYVDG